jgi:hypothetical protein
MGRRNVPARGLGHARLFPGILGSEEFMKKTLVLGTALLVLAGYTPSGQGTSSSLSVMRATPRVEAQTGFGRMPLYFVRGTGEPSENAIFSVRGKDKSIYFSPEGLTFILGERQAIKPASVLDPAGAAGGGQDRGHRRWTLKLDFVDSNPDVRPEGADPLPTVISYFKGRPEDWRTGLPAYSRIVYANLWPGIDLIYSGTPGKLKYEFVVRPGADPSRIKLAYRGAEPLSVDGEGRLTVATPMGSFQDDRPSAFQEVDGKKAPVALAYALENEAASDARQAYGFRVGSYDKTKTLVLDPTILVYCGFIGGAGDDRGMSVAVDSAGCAYVVGSTMSDETSFPVATGPDLVFNGGNMDAFVAKVKADGTGLVYCGYIGGAQNDLALGVAVDSSGNAYIAGVTASDQTSFPVVNGPSLVFKGGAAIPGYPEFAGDAFVAKVNSAGTGLSYCGYIGGDKTDVARGIAVNSAGAAYVTGVTLSSETSFPVKVGPDLTMNGPLDAFVAKVKPDGTGFDYCGYVGGANGDTWGQGLALDTSGSAYVAGFSKATESYGFPVNIGPGLISKGGYDAFVAKVKPDGTGLTYCGFIGGANDDRGFGIAVDGLGCAYITGDTGSSEATFPVKVGPDLTFNGGSRDAFVAKVMTDGTGLVYCGYVGGSNDNDSGNSIGVAQVAGNWTAYISGSTNSSEFESFPVTLGPGLTYGGAGDGFIARVTASGAYLVFCGYIGGAGVDNGIGLAVDSSGIAYISGWMNSVSGFPAVVGPDLAQNGSYDAFVAKVTDGLAVPVMTGPPNGAQQQPLTVGFEWTDPNTAPQEKGYYLRYKIAGGNYAYYTTFPDTTSLYPNWFTLNTTYNWNVQALSNNTTDFPDSAWANGGVDFSFRTIGSYVLFAPVLSSPASGSVNQPTSLTLRWIDTNSNPQETKYQIRIKPAGGAYSNFAAAKDATSYLLKGRSPNKTYSWNVKAVGNGTTVGDSPWANGGVDWTFTTAAPVKLNAPVLVSPANGATDQPLSVTLRWTDTNSSPQEVGYQVRFKPAGGAYKTYNVGQNVAQLVRSGLLKNKVYSWNVRATGDGKGLLTSAWANGGVDWKFTTQK